MRVPYLILCSENDDLAPYQTIHNFATRLQELGGNVKLVKWNDSLTLVSILLLKLYGYLFSPNQILLN